MSRYAHRASQGFLDVSWHGSAEDDQAMREIIRADKKEADKEEYLVLHVRPIGAKAPQRGGGLVVLPGSEDEGPLKEPLNELMSWSGRPRVEDGTSTLRRR